MLFVLFKKVYKMRDKISENYRPDVTIFDVTSRQCMQPPIWEAINTNVTLWKELRLLYWLRKGIWFYWSVSVDIKTG